MKILTLNIWGAPYAKHRSERVAAIVDEVTRIDADILCFQEVYLPDNRQDLIAGLVDRWRYHHYFPSALVGSGLLTMSKYPIMDARFYAFRMRGKPDDIKRGDYYAGKGIGLARIDVGAAVVDVYNCHTHAQYDADNDNEYAVYNETNLYEAARFIDSQSGASPVILCGDLNTRPDQAGYQIITKMGSLVDAGLHVNQAYLTTYSAENPYSESVDQCLDYVMARNIGVSSVEIVMAGLLSGEALTYSDHYGMLAEFQFNGEKLNQFAVDVAPVIEALYERVNHELIDSEAQQIKHLERSVFGLASVLDGWLMSAFLSRFNRRIGQSLRWLGFILALVFAVWHVMQAGVNLQGRKNTLEGIRQELQKQMVAKRLFDGREW